MAALNKSVPATLATIPADPNGLRAAYITAMNITTAGTIGGIAYGVGVYPYNPDGWATAPRGSSLTVATAAGMMCWTYS